MPPPRDGGSSPAFELDELPPASGLDDEDALAESSRSGQERVPLIAPPSLPASSRRGRGGRYVDHPYAGHAAAASGREEASILPPALLEKFRGSKVVRVANRFSVSHEPGLSTTQLMLTNDDLEPVEPARRQWGTWNYVGFWVADSFNINTWMISSSMVVAGLSWWQSWLCVWVGYFVAAMFVCLTGRIGTTYHIGFPVVSRASFGIWGALWPVINRAAMACIWYGVQSWIGGGCVQLMIRAVWNVWDPPASDSQGVTGSSGTNLVDFTSFLIFWVASLPALWFPAHKIRHLFTVKAYVVPTASIVFFVWVLARAKGLGPIIHQKSRLQGSDLAWAVISGVMSAIANFATLIVNNPDFARFAGKPEDAVWSQLLTIPIGFAVTSFIGIMVSSASAVIWGGEPVWNPLDVLTQFLDEGGLGQRCGVFVIAAAFTLAQLGTNIAANSVSAGTDMTALLPRFINIRRGGYICATVGLIICPWKLLSSSSQFLVYLSGYSVFMSSIAGVIVCDYYIVRKGYYQIKDLYSGRRTAPYYFTGGVHWRAYAAYIAGIAINVVGFVGAAGVPVPDIATHIYNFNYFGGFLVSGTVYCGLCRAFPIPATSDSWLEVGDEIGDPRLTYDDDESDNGSYNVEALPHSARKSAEIVE